jgi:hypothetical protein
MSDGCPASRAGDDQAPARRTAQDALVSGFAGTLEAYFTDWLLSQRRASPGGGPATTSSTGAGRVVDGCGPNYAQSRRIYGVYDS